jgi:hypothetical protein
MRKSGEDDIGGDVAKDATAVFLTIFKIAFLSDARKRVRTPKSRFRNPPTT